MHRHFATVPGAALLAAIVIAGVPAPARAASTGLGYDVQVVVDGVPLTEYAHDGRTWVEGRLGARYALRVRNETASRVEVVATVDGLDALDGHAGDWSRKRGYVLGPWQTYDIEGFRLDLGRVAAFRFSRVADSYAAKTGDARNVGVIGVAFFPERPRPVAIPRPAYVAPPMMEQGLRGAAAGDGRGYLGAQGGPADDRAAPGTSAMPAPAAKAEVQGTPGGGRAQQRREEAERRPGLGTEFGESRGSRVHETSFVRASGGPAVVLAIGYNDRNGLMAMGIPVDSACVDDTWLRRTANPFPATPPRPFATPPAGWRPD
jgi:hypothetical protein